MNKLITDSNLSPMEYWDLYPLFVYKMAGTSIDFVEQKRECDVCTFSSADLITNDCNHSCCKEWNSNIDKHHTCRAKFDEINIMITDAYYDKHVRFAFFY